MENGRGHQGLRTPRAQLRRNRQRARGSGDLERRDGPCDASHDLRMQGSKDISICVL